MRTLSLRELNRATLARQLLLRRARLPLLPAVERIAGLQGQWPPAPYVGLWSRLEGFHRQMLERALSRQQIVKATLMRLTLHLVTARDYPMFSAAVHGGTVSPLKAWALELADRTSEDVRALFAEGPRTRQEILDWLDSNHGPIEAGDQPWMMWTAIRVRAHLMHAPSTALWNARPAGRYVALNGVVLPDPDAARVELVRRYLGAFGPATRADVAAWTGLRIRDFAPALDALEPLRRFRNEEGYELLDLPRAPLPDPATPAPVRFLPKWDSLLLGHADRRRVLPEEYRTMMIARNGEIAQSFLVDGLVAGTWKLDGERVRLEPYDPIPRAAKRELEDEAARLEAFVR